MESRYNVVFSGEIIPTFTPEEAARAFATLSRVPEDKVRAMIDSGLPKVIKRDVDEATAQRTAAVLSKTGLLVNVELAEAVALDMDMEAMDRTRLIGLTPTVGSAWLEPPTPEAAEGDADGGLSLVARPVEEPAPAVILPPTPKRVVLTPIEHHKRAAGFLGNLIWRLSLVLLVIGMGVGIYQWRQQVAADRPTGLADWTRPATAPNGSPWPQAADYVAGYERLLNDGYSQLSIDNRQGEADLFLKLVTLDGLKPTVIRVFYVPAKGRFEIDNVIPGRYDLRIRNLATGALMRTDPFEIRKVETAEGARYSTWSFVQAREGEGGTEVHAIAESEF